MKRIINEKNLILLSLLLLLPLFSGCFSVPSINHAPTITSTEIITATVGVVNTYNINAADPDVGDTLTYSLTTKPAGMAINSTTGLINWAPTSTGDYEVTVIISDGSLLVTQSFTITVSEVPPVPPVPPTPPTPPAPPLPPAPPAPPIPPAPPTPPLPPAPSIPPTPPVPPVSPTPPLPPAPPAPSIPPTPPVAPTPPAPQTPQILTSIIVSPAVMEIYVGNSNTITSITANYYNGDSADLDLTDCDYESDNDSIATVNDNGIITGVSVGSATITVSYIEGAVTETDTIGVTVTEAPKVLTSITVLPDTMTLEIGESEAITSVTAHYDNNTNANIALNACTYVSSKPNIASVSSSGVIKGRASCTASTAAIITVSYTENGITKTDTVSVVVTNPSPG